MLAWRNIIIETVYQVSSLPSFVSDLGFINMQNRLAKCFQMHCGKKVNHMYGMSTFVVSRARNPDYM